MNPKTKAKPKPLELTPQELAKVQRTRARSEVSKLEPEWEIVAEFGYYYGWEAIAAILNNEISFEIVERLLRGARRVRYGKVIDYAVATEVAVASAHSKKPRVNMKKGLNHFMKAARN